MFFKHRKYQAVRKLTKEIELQYSLAADFLRSQPSDSIYQLTDDEKREIDEFWAQYGVKFPDYTWFQMFYGVSGIRSPKFLIDIFVISSIYNYYNVQRDVDGWNDKNIFERLVKNVKFPDSLAHKINRRYYDDDYKPYDNTEDGIKRLSERIFSKLNGETDMIVKESKDSCQGRGVRLIKDVHCADDSFNTWHDKNEIKIFPATIRFGVEGSATDIIFDGEKEIANVVGIDENGIINDKFRSFDGVVENHPIIKDKQVPSWDKLLNAVVEAHKEMFHFDIIGWDFTVDKDGNPICIEYNITQPGTILYQFTNGPMAGKYTEEYLAYLKKRPDLVPYLYRLKT